MTRQEMITDFQHFLDAHKEEVEANICQPPFDFLDDDWEEVQERSMENVVDIEKNLEYEVSELICLKCLHRWIDIYPVITPLKELECKCGAVGYAIKTGQTMPE